MNYDLEKLNELKDIKGQLRSLNWMVFVALCFIIPICSVILLSIVAWGAAFLEIAKAVK